jgi:protein ImuB
MLWLSVQFPSLGLEIFADDGDAERPRVLSEGGKVVLCNSEARKLGIRTGSSNATAQSICSDLRVIERNYQQEQKRLEALAEHAYDYSSRVSIDEPSGLLLEVGGSLRLFGTALVLDTLIHDRFGHLGHRSRTAFAHTPLAASTLALADAGFLPEDPTDEERLELQTLEHLRLVPLARCGWEEDLVQRFANMGITQLGEALRLPRASLGKRFGKALLTRLEKLTGEIADPRIHIEPSPYFETQLHFLEDVTELGALLFPMQRLLKELSTWLTSRQLLADCIVWNLSHPRHESAQIEVKLARPRLDYKSFLTLTKLHLERTTPLPEVASIGLEMRNPIPLQSQNESLLRSEASTSRPPEELIDLLYARLGEKAFTSVLPADDHRPECAWRAVKPQVKDLVKEKVKEKETGKGREIEKGKEGQQESQTKEWREKRPLWLLRKPRPLANLDRVELIKGPERIDVGWWERERPRDYFIATTTGGTFCWVFQDLLSGHWFLHGYFA